MSADQTMAVRRVRPGVAEWSEVAIPTTQLGEVLVELRHAALNPFDLQVLRGEIGDPTRVLTLGAEGVGVIDGQLVQVSGQGLGAGRDGTFAPWVAAPENAIRPIPEGVDPRLAACVGVAGKTAWRAVHQLAAVGGGDVVLVLGATGGVGQFAAQLARSTGALVLAHSGDAVKAERLADLGLTPVLAETPEELAAALDPGTVSVVLDPLGGDYVSRILGALAPLARVVTYGVLAGRATTLDLQTLYGKGIRIIGTSGGTTSPAESAEGMDGALRALAAGEVRLDVEAVPFADALAAMDRLATRRVTGKLVLDI